MSTFIDLSGTAGLPIPSELEESAAEILHRGSNVNDALQRVHAKWSLLTGAYSAPEQAQVQGAMHRPATQAKLCSRLPPMRPRH